MAAPSYTHRVSPRARRLTLKVESSGEVIVVTPRFTPQWLINQFVEKQAAWISHQLEKLTQQQPGQTESILLFGQAYSLKLVYSDQAPIGVTIVDKEVRLNPVEPAGSAAWTKAQFQQLHRFLKQTARAYIEPRSSQLSQLMQIEYQQIRYKQQKSRWGSCSSYGNLNFNWRLVHCPPEVIDYVIIHELAHRKQMNHSSRFWELVAHYSPDYRLHRGWLKRHGRFFV